MELWVEEDGKSKSHSVTGWIGVDLRGNNTPRDAAGGPTASEQTSIGSFFTRKLD